MSLIKLVKASVETATAAAVPYGSQLLFNILIKEIVLYLCWKLMLAGLLLA